MKLYGSCNEGKGTFCTYYSYFIEGIDGMRHKEVIPQKRRKKVKMRE